jgi:serine protease 16
VCNDLFGLDKVSVFEGIKLTNVLYGGLYPSTSRILFVNGDIDPWHTLSVLKDQSNKGDKAVFIAGASHCQDMESSDPDDSVDLTQGRREIDSVLSGWLNEAKDVNNRMSPQ